VGPAFRVRTGTTKRSPSALATSPPPQARGLLVLEPAEDHLLLENVAVAPQAQGLGVGGRLLRLAEEQALARGLREVRLYTNEAMTENLAYYLRRGYSETHRATQDGFRPIFFTKPLELVTELDLVLVEDRTARGKE